MSRRSSSTVVAGHGGGVAVGPKQGRQDADQRGLAGAMMPGATAALNTS